MSQTLLLVDDETSVLNALKRVLRKQNYNIITASNGKEALQLLAEHNNEIAVVVSDFRMPFMTGAELLKEISKKYPQTVRMILSGYADRDQIIDTINSGQIYKFLSKPWDDEVLRNEIDQAFQQADLQHYKEDLDILFNQQNSGMFTTSENHVILKANKFFMNLTGYQEEIVGRCIYDEQFPLFHPHNLQVDMEDTLALTNEWNGEGYLITQDENYVAVSLYARRFKTAENGPTKYFYQIIDISKQKQLEADIQYRLNYNEVTGLYNRHYLIENLPSLLEQMSVRRKQLALAIVEIDRFANIFNAFGNRIANQMLRKIGRWMNDWCESKGILTFHLSGNKFAFVFPNMINTAHLEQRLHDFQESLKIPFNHNEHKIYVTASIGVSLYPQGGVTPEKLMKNAELALTRAQTLGGNTFVFQESSSQNFEDPSQQLLYRLTIESELFEAVAQKQFELYYQPFVDVETGEAVSCEALLRWHHPDRGLIYPKEFIGILEETGLIVELGEWIISQACQQLNNLSQAGFPEMRISINLSARQLQDPTFYDRLLKIVNHTGVSPSRLELEMTESMLMENFTQCRIMLENLRHIGVNLALDDFGTGYSSFSVLKDLPFNILKIDRSFIHEINQGRNSASIVSSIIAMGQSLGMKIVAEGVETPEQLHTLRQYNCDFAQGYYFSIPLTKDELLEFLQKKKS